MLKMRRYRLKTRLDIEILVVNIGQLLQTPEKFTHIEGKGKAWEKSSKRYADPANLHITHVQLTGH